MGIDWFTLIAQIVNFLILVGVLKFFLYERIIKAMDEREERIHTRMEEAEQKKLEAEDEAESYRNKKRELEEKENEIFEEARRKAGEHRKELVSNAREEVEIVERKWRDQLEREKSDFLHDLQRMAGRRVEEATRKVLEDLADTKLEARMIEAFLRHLEEMDEDERNSLRESLSDSGNVTVRSSFEISGDQRGKIFDGIAEILSKETEVRYEISNDPICGIVLAAGGKKVSWSFAGYLSDLEETFSRAIEETAQQDEERRKMDTEEDKTGKFAGAKGSEDLDSSGDGGEENGEA